MTVGVSCVLFSVVADGEYTAVTASTYCATGPIKRKFDDGFSGLLRCLIGDKGDEKLAIFCFKFMLSYTWDTFNHIQKKQKTDFVAI